MTTLQDKAQEALSHFVKHNRTDDDVILVVSDDAPEWVHDMVYRAHDDGAMLPDDWRYEFITDALGELSENEDPDEISIEADIYTSDLTRWLGSRADRYCFIDEAVADMGHADSVLGDIGMGQVAEREEVLSSVRSFLEKMIENEEDAEEAE